MNWTRFLSHNPISFGPHQNLKTLKLTFFLSIFKSISLKQSNFTVRRYKFEAFQKNNNIFQKKREMLGVRSSNGSSLMSKSQKKLSSESYGKENRNPSSLMSSESDKSIKKNSSSEFENEFFINLRYDLISKNSFLVSKMNLWR